MRASHVRPLRHGVVLLAAGLVACAGKVDEETYNEAIADIRSSLEEHEARISENASSVDDLEGRVAGLESELQQLRQEFDAKITKLEESIRFNLPVHFAFDRAAIRSVDRPVLNRFASVAKEYYPRADITVEGFADPAGSTAYNIDLSRRRAESVKQYLTREAGMSGDRIKTVAYGEARNRQVAPGERGPGPSGLENRRVTFVVEYAGEAEAADQQEDDRAGSAGGGS